MKLNSNFRCGLPSSRKLHNPAIRRRNRALKQERILRILRTLQAQQAPVEPRAVVAETSGWFDRMRARLSHILKLHR